VARFMQWMAGFILGAAVGAALVLLLTPQSGQELQATIRERAQEIQEAGKQAAETRRLELTEQLEALKHSKE
jgi:gas vesicle protein